LQIAKRPPQIQLSCGTPVGSETELRPKQHFCDILFRGQKMYMVTITDTISLGREGRRGAIPQYCHNPGACIAKNKGKNTLQAV